MSERLQISYFTDVLCVWAYISQIRIDELKRQFGERIHVEHHFVPIFGCTERRIGEGWKDRGGYAGFGDHVRGVCTEFPHVTVAHDVWDRVTPSTSALAHHFLKAVQLLEKKRVISSEPCAEFDGRSLFEEASWRVRLAFFRDARDVSRIDCLLELAEELEIPVERLRGAIDEGEAMAQLFRDVELRDQYRVEGSPTWVFNQGRQKLYGNLGYKILEANVHEVLNRPENRASWC